MKTFILNCDVVTQKANEISNLSSSMRELSSKVKGYNTDNEENFNFEEAKTVIFANIRAAAKKIENTAKLMNNVVSTHEALQQSLSQNDFTDPNKNLDSDAPQVVANKPSAPSTSGSQSSSGYSTPTTIKTSPKVNYQGYEYSIEEDEESLNKKYKIVIDTEGYLRRAGRYVVSCNESMGKVGDEIDVVNENNQTIKCIIGKTFSDETKQKNRIIFAVDSNKFTDKKEIAMNIIKATNLGNYKNNKGKEGVDNE